MEHRQGVEHLVLGIGRHGGQRLGYVGKNVPVREHDALGGAFRPRRKQNNGGRVGIAFDARRHASHQTLQLVRERDRAPDIFQIDDANACRFQPGDHIAQTGLVDEGPRRQHHFDLGGLAGGLHIYGTRRVVQHRGHAADALQRIERHHNAGCVGQQHTNRGAFGGERLQLGAEHLRTGEQFLIGEACAERVFDHHRSNVALGLGRGQRFEQGPVDARVANRALHHNVIERRARCPASLTACERRIKRQLARRLNGDPHFGKAHLGQLRHPEKTEGCPFQSLDPYGDDIGISLVSNQACALIDLHQAAGDRQPPFRENHQRLAALDDVDEIAGGERLGRVHGVGIDQLQEGFHPPGLGNPAIDRKRGIARQQRVHHRAIHEAGMVGRDNGARPGWRQVFKAGDFQAIGGPEDQHGEILHALAAPSTQHQRHGDKIADGRQCKDAGH